MKETTIGIILLIFISSCNYNKGIKSDIQYNIPDSLNQWDYKYYQETKSYSDLLGLNHDLTKNDSFEIRIWFDFQGLRAFPKMLLIKKINKSWTILEYTWMVSLTEEIRKITHIDSVPKDLYNYYQLDSCIIKNCGVPKSGWNDFIKKIDFDNLKRISSQSELISYKNRIKNKRCDVDDGIVYNIELITNKEYKFISYHCPGSYSKCLKCKSNERVNNLIELLWEEFPETRYIIYHLFGKKVKNFRC